MKTSRIFTTNEYLSIQDKIKYFINSQTDFLSPRTARSTRAVGDAIQDLLADRMGVILGEHVINYQPSFARRAMADLAFFDRDGFYYAVDVKTHRLDTEFNMPNLISVERLARFYEDDENYFVLLEIGYSVQDIHVEVEHVHFVPIEFLGWDCLTIGALGWGQIQIANSNRIDVAPSTSRREWMIALCDRLFEFYPREIEKIGERIEYFRKVKQHWLERTG